MRLFVQSQTRLFPESIEKVGNENDVSGLSFGFRCFDNGESLAIRMKVEVAVARSAVRELLFGPEARFVSAERVRLRVYAATMILWSAVR